MSDGTTYLVIHETTTGTLLRQTSPVRVRGEARLAMPDDKRIFVTIEIGGDSDDAFWTTPNSPVGTYVMSEDADTAERLAPEAALPPNLAGLHPSSDRPAVLIGTLPDGGYLFSDLQYAAAARHPGRYLSALDPVTTTQRTFPLPVDSDPGSFHLSRSGKRLAFTDEHRPSFTAASTVSMWVLELESGKPSKVRPFPSHDPIRHPDGPRINLIGWLEDE